MRRIPSRKTSFSILSGRVSYKTDHVELIIEDVEYRLEGGIMKGEQSEAYFSQFASPSGRDES